MLGTFFSLGITNADAKEGWSIHRWSHKPQGFGDGLCGGFGAGKKCGDISDMFDISEDIFLFI